MEKMRVALLQSMPIFGALPQEAIEFLVDDSALVIFEPDTYMIRQNDPAGTVYILENGRAEVVKCWQERDYSVDWVKRGDVVGELSLLDPSPRCASVIAREITHCIALEPIQIYRLRQENLAWFTLLQMNIAREVCRRLRAVEARLFALMADRGCEVSI